MEKEIKEVILKYPRTRYMGSKQKLLNFIYNNVKDLKFKKVLDAFSGSGCVSYLFKGMGKEVHSNDFLRSNYIIAKALIENNTISLNNDDLQLLLSKNSHDNFISKTFSNLYFNDNDNLFLDNTYSNIQKLNNEYKKALALAALSRSCIKKRSRGIFTYTGMRYNDGRNDLKLSLKEHFINSINAYNSSIFNNNKENLSFNSNIFNLKNNNYDLVYIDPPYCSIHSDNDYSRRYHFIEGLMSKWTHVSINQSTKTKKFNKFETPFDSKDTVYEAFDTLFNNFKDSILVVSYSSNSLPSLQQMLAIMKKYKSNVIVKEFDHKYSFGNQKSNIKNNKVKEYLFIGVD